MPSTQIPASSAATPSTRHRTSRFLLLAAMLACATVFLLLPLTSAYTAQAAHAHGFSSVSILPRMHATTSKAEYWHTAGNLIEDGHNRPVRISGLNWSGFETTNAVVGGLEQQDYRAILGAVRLNGYNTVRIPLSNEMVETPRVPDHIAFRNAGGAINEDLRDLDSLEILDRIVAAAGKEGLRVILDNHRSEAGSSAEESGLWYTERFPESAWIADWVTLARRYQGNPTVVGVDLRNEPHNAGSGGACWDCGGANDWHLAAERAGDAVLRVNPRLLVFVEGTDQVNGTSTWWGGNLAGVRRSPVRLRLPGHVVYSAHVYGPAEFQQPWFNAGTTSASLAALWRRDWAYISESGIAPVWIGEFGTANDPGAVRDSAPGSQGQWFSALVGFLRTHPEIGWTYWGANGEDRYALLDASYSGQPASMEKAEALASISGSQTGESASTASSLMLSRPVPDPLRSAPRTAGPVEASMTVVPVPAASAETTPGALSTEDRGEQARQQVARAWHTPALSTGITGATPSRVSPPAGRPAETSISVRATVADQVNRATSDALHALDAGRE